MLIVAALEHAMNRLVDWTTTCITERARGFDSPSSEDYLQAEAARLAFVEREAEDECSEPETAAELGLRILNRSIQFMGRAASENRLNPLLLNADGTPNIAARGLPLFVPNAPYSPAASAGCGESSSLEVSANPPAAPSRERGGPCCGLCSAKITCIYCGAPAAVFVACGEVDEPVCLDCFEFQEPVFNPFNQDPSSTTGRQPRVDGEGLNGDSDIPAVAAVEAPSEKMFTIDEWVAWVVPAIEDVLAEHRPRGGTFSEGTAGKVECITFTSVHRVCDDWQDWRSHVALLIAQRINIAASQADRPSIIETGHDMGVSFASELFPQSQKRPQ